MILIPCWGDTSEFPVLPEVELRALDGESTVRPADFKGKPVLLTFWASWCGPCRAELPELAKLSKELESKGFVLLSVNVDQSKNAAVRFLQRYSIDIPVYRAAPNDLVRLGIKGLPTSILLNLDGERVQVYEGYVPSVIEDIRRRVYEMYGEKPEESGEWIGDP